MCLYHVSYLLLFIDFNNAESNYGVFANLPTSSFIETYLSDYEKFFKSKSQKFVFHLNQRINKHATCNELEFVNVPSDIEAPLMGGKIFSKINGLNNQRATWFNGVEYLSYANVGSHGTWIVGKNPGEDNGFIFVRPEHTTFTPIGIESNVPWKWNLNGDWVDMHQLKVICNDHNEKLENTSLDPYFYEVNSYYSSSDFSIQEETSQMFLIPIVNDSRSGSATKVQAYFPDHTMKTFFLHSIRIICAEGIPVKLQRSPAISAMARLVNHEMGTNHAWRMSFRYLDADPLYPAESSAKTTFSREAEVLISLDSKSGEFRDSWKVQALNEIESSNYNAQMSGIVESVNVGDYIWIWSTSDFNVNESSNYISLAPDFEKATEMLLLCLSKHQSINTKTFVFRYFPHDRRDQMGQTSLARDIQLVKIAVIQDKVCMVGDLCKSSNQMPSMLVSTTLADHRQYVRHVLHGVVYIGANPVPMMRRYVAEKEMVNLFHNPYYSSTLIQTADIVMLYASFVNVCDRF